MWYNCPSYFDKLATKVAFRELSQRRTMKQYRNTLILHIFASMIISTLIITSLWNALPGSFAVASITLGTTIGITAIAGLFYIAINHKEIVKKLCLLYENWLTMGTFTMYFVIKAIHSGQLFSGDTLVATLCVAIISIKYLQNIGLIKKED